MNISFIKKITIGCSCSLLLSACLPLYRANTEPHTVINTTMMPSPEMCVDGKAYKLDTDASGNAQIPANKNISVASNYVSSDGRVTWSCRPVIGFMPEENKKYVGVIHFKDRACRLQILRENSDTPSGLDWDRTLWKGICPRN